MTRALRFQSGSSFIEVVAAVAVFALVAIGLSPALLSARKFADLGRDQSIATALAQDKLEQIRQMTAASIANGSDGPLQPNGSPNGIYSRSWTVNANQPITGVNQVAVTVTWRERANTNQIRLVTLVPQ